MPDTLIDRHDGVVTVTFNRPEKKNAINAAIWQALDEVVREVAANPEDRALVITGAGGCFSAGADLMGSGEKGTSVLTGGPQQSILVEMRTVGDIIGRLQHLAKPTLAVVDGVAVGVALGVALACDLVLASDRATFSEVFVKRGLALDGGTSWSLPRAVGLRRAKQIAFFGDMIDAEQALEWGMINEVVPTDDLERVAAEWARKLATAPTTALSLIKRLLDNSAHQTFDQAIEDEARAQHITFTTKDLKEGMRAFMERREPNFTGT